MQRFFLFNLIYIPPKQYTTSILFIISQTKFERNLYLLFFNNIFMHFNLFI